MAGAILAAASAAQAGIVIPAGDWTLDVSGNVNAYTSWSSTDNSKASVVGGLVNPTGSTTQTVNTFGNGLLPNFLSFGGTTRQNDLDVAFLISLQPGSASSAALQGVGGSNNGGLNNRQAYITFGDKSWGSVKVGKDLGIFASDAILSDMTLLGVGSAATASGNTSLGRIGAGYIYADWKPQIAYTTPNFSGFQATVGISQAFKATTYVGNAGTSYDFYGSTAQTASPAYEGKASYAFNANGVDGKLWVSGIAQKTGAASTVSVTDTSNVVHTSTIATGIKNNDPIAYAVDIGGNANVAGFGLTAYGYYGEGIGSEGQMVNGYGVNTTGAANALSERTSYGGYVQATYILPTKTKAGISWGESKLDRADGENAANTNTLMRKNDMWTAGLYHPLTKHLNLVGEYSYVRSQNQLGSENNSNIGSVGAILFF